MTGKVFSYLIVIIVLFPFTAKAQDYLHKNTRTVVTLAGKEVNRVYIPPPEKFKRYINSKGATGAKVNINNFGFTGTPKTALEYAVSIFASVLPSNAEITISATWRQLADANVLGQSSASSFILGSAFDAPYRLSYYPVSLAEKMSGGFFNSNLEADISLTINSKIEWYTGTDGNHPPPPAPNKYDLVTVILHELLHGIGFYDSFSTDNLTGSYGLNSIPVVFDYFVENFDGKKLIANPEFPDNSSELYSQLTSDKIYFNGPVLSSATNGSRARLFAPSEFMPGSSIAHLDETRTSTANKLMTPYVNYGEVFHSPGPLTMAILGDLGWVHTRIVHEKFSDTENNISSLPVTATILSDTLFEKDRAALVYSFTNSMPEDTLFLTPPVDGNIFTALLTSLPYNSFISYYFSVTDSFGRVYRLPSNGLQNPYRFYIGTDTVKPVLKHTKPDFFFDKITAWDVKCSASDNIGIDTVYIEYRKNSGSSFFKGLSKDQSGLYGGNVNIKSLGLAQGDSFQYKIFAADKAAVQNVKTFPSSGYTSVEVMSTLPVVKSFDTDFAGASSNFILNGFTVSRPSLFSTTGLHSRHPYESPDKDGEEINTYAYLKQPVEIDETGIVMTYKEIVLVEPGEPGSIFGDTDFFDYVVVEGSTDFGASWFALKDGYDSRISSTFEDAYNSRMSGNNSTFVGKEDMYIPNNIDIRTFEKFSKGDTLMVRFRLFSDPFAHGWGWAVDDLSIKSVAAGISDDKAPHKTTVIYPNPGNGYINISFAGASLPQQLRYTVRNLSGMVVYEANLFSDTNGMINISDKPDGIYLITFSGGGLSETHMYIKNGK